MLNETILQFELFLELAQAQLPFMAKVLAGLWIINLINWTLLRSRLCVLGIYPRSIPGLIGIIFAPFLHANFNHLFFNTIPFFVLGMFILAMGQTVFIKVSILIALGEGVLVWLFGRKYLHIGASGIIAGYFGFVLGLAYMNPGVISILLAAVAVYYFGSIFAGIIPSDATVSWESHFAGLISGLALSLLM